jgi:large subunit ribosomal protein L21
MKYAIIVSGGKQYKVVEGSTISVDLLQEQAGQQLDLNEVLLLVDGEVVTVGSPNIKGAKVNTTIVTHEKGPKVVNFRYSPKKRIRTKNGHRQQYTRLMIEKIEVE